MLRKDDDIISKSLFHRHHWQITGLEELATLARTRLPEKGVFLDLGAHVGALISPLKGLLGARS